MTVKQFTRPKTHNFTQLLTAGSLAIGVVAGISAAPAQAVSLANGDITYSHGISTFFNDVNPVPGQNDTININFGSTTTVSTANGSLSPYFTPATTTSFTTAPTAIFDYVSGTNAFYTYTLRNDIDFGFVNGVNVVIGAGTVFTGNKSSTAVSFSTIDESKSYFKNGTDNTPLTGLSFGFNDIKGSGNGTYGITASSAAESATAIPEPFTMIGTLVGGTAALRMRKKLKDSTGA